MTPLLPRVEARSVAVGALTTIVLAVPPALLGVVLSDDGTLEGSSWVPLLFAWIIVAFVAGGFVAARAQAHAPSVHGAAAAFCGYALVQAVGIVRHLAADEPLAWLSIAFSALLAASTGLVGGLLANRRRVRHSRARAAAA